MVGARALNRVRSAAETKSLQLTVNKNRSVGTLKICSVATLPNGSQPAGFPIAVDPHTRCTCALWLSV
jgi:hypothetical protein